MSVLTTGRALAFDVALIASPELTLVVHTARGVNLPAPATALALSAAATLLGDAAQREGARFIIVRAAERIARMLLPDAGVRAPSGRDVVLTGSGESDSVLFMSWARGSASAAPEHESATRANEAALLSRSADDARFAGDRERARRLDLEALERAPRHPQIARRIAELDWHAGGRAEAATLTLRSADQAGCLGSLLADLLLEMGDRSGAIAALLREGERDPSAGVAALAYACAATLAVDPADALAWLDNAIARAPLLAELRWDRAQRRLVQGRIGDARADFQELETLAHGPRERYDVLKRAADIHRERGLGSDAALLYERALLYRPDDPEAIAGLGAAIAAEGRGPRGATLVARAIELASTRLPAENTAWMELELGRILGDRLGDRPAAVARLRAVPDAAPEAIDARGLEGRYRAALGDAAGASLAFARLRERAGRDRAAAPWLEEAARFEEARGELALAQAHLAAALAIAPTNASIEASYRAVSEQIAHAAGVRPRFGVPEGGTRFVPRSVVLEGGVPEGGPLPSPSLPEPPPPQAIEEAAPTPEEDEMKIEALTRTLQGDPTNDDVVDELVLRLTRLGRSMELLALLSARLEDAPPERRAELLPRHREVLERLEVEARAAGRDGEADLFKMAREMS
jgi:hypothetical protein